MSAVGDLARSAFAYRPHPLEAAATARRQRKTLAEVGHRPWPLPGRQWLIGQSWRHLLFAHWQVEPEALRAVVPPQLALDLHDESAWVGLTPFRVEGFRLRRTLPVPVFSRFPEVNVRTYVNHGGRPGIYFLSLDADSQTAVAGARRTYRLPYFRARQSFSDETDSFHFRSVRVSADGPPAELECSFAPAGECFVAEPGTLAHFLTERYCLYTLAAGGTVHRGEIHHPPWPLQPARGTFAVNTMTKGYRLELQGEPLLHYSGIQDVVLWTIAPVSTPRSGPLLSQHGRGD